MQQVRSVRRYAWIAVPMAVWVLPADFFWGALGNMFSLSPSQNWKKNNVLIAEQDVHTKSHIYQCVREANYFYFVALFCPVDLNSANMHTVAEKSAASPGSDEESLNLQHVLSTFLCSICNSLPPLTDCVFVVWAFSVLSL